MRADRLFSIVLMLQSRRMLTSRELARRLEVSARTIHRDMDALSAAGIPVVAERGTGGGWSLLGEYRTNLTGLSQAEAQSLFVANSSRLLADLKLEKAAEGAFLKLLAALPGAYRQGAEHARRLIHVDVTGWRRAQEEVPLLGVVQDAVWQGRRLRMAYGQAECGATERVVDPLGLVAKGGVWYLVAGVGGEVRSYRVSRIASAETLDERAARPPDFDLADYWEQSAARLSARPSNYTMRARARAEIVPVLAYAGRFARVGPAGPADEEGWHEVSVGFDAEDIARDFALGFGDRLEVLEPRGLREKVVEAARRVVAFYEG